jgi:hypothetical protein
MDKASSENCRQKNYLTLMDKIIGFNGGKQYNPNI